MLAGALVLLVESRLFREDWRASPPPRRAPGARSPTSVVFGSLVGFTAFAYCLNELPATTVGTYAYVNPVVAVALGGLILGEPLSPASSRARRSSCVGGADDVAHAEHEPDGNHEPNDNHDPIGHLYDTGGHPRSSPIKNETNSPGRSSP